jgi:predicted small integral membrane protein
MSNNDGNDQKNATQPGFLPIITNTFDRIFIGAVIFVALHLLWMRFVEAYIPLYVATILSVLIGAMIVARG